MNKMIELLLSRRQSVKYESDCQDVNSFLSRYFDFNSMCRFIVTINQNRLKKWIQ